MIEAIALVVGTAVVGCAYFCFWMWLLRRELKREQRITRSNRYSRSDHYPNGNGEFRPIYDEKGNRIYP